MESYKTENATAPNAKEGANRGAAIGAIIGQTIGAMVDVVLGAVAGGMDAGSKSNAGMANVLMGTVTGAITAGKAAVGKTEEPADPAAEQEFWRKEFASRPYGANGSSYEQYAPAFQYGWDSQAAHKGKSFNDVESQLAREWESRRGTSRLTWTQAKNATHDAWQRVEKAACGESCSA